jgi:hypothetical protein
MKAIACDRYGGPLWRRGVRQPVPSCGASDESTPLEEGVVPLPLLRRVRVYGHRSSGPVDAVRGRESAIW